MEIKPVMEASWLAQMQPAFEQPYFLALKEFLLKERMTHIIYPPGSLIFNAFNLTPFDKVKVVIIGQDPYHGHGQAHGLCFSVPKGIAQPPSLVNIFKELNTDLGCSIPKHGNLEKWAKQGVLLLNAVLTVRANNASSHQNKGWELFTDFAIQQLNKHKEHLVFLLWGNFARSKASLIDKSKHLILETVHPSPLSAYNGFFGCKHFSKTNSYLKELNIEPIDWQIE